MAKKNEIYLKIPNSYEEKLQKIRDAVKASSDFGVIENEWDLSVEATLPDSIIVRRSLEKGDEYYKANWSFNDNGEVKFSEIRKIEIDAVIKVKNESRGAVKTLDESFDISLQSGNIILTETIKDGKKTTRGRVNEAQKGDELNQNNRIYKSDILLSAFNEAKESLKDNGPMLMYSGHKIDNGKNYDGLEGVVAVIKDIEWDDTAKAIHLNEIEFPDTPIGREHIALLEAGVKLQVSQRGEGVSHFEKKNGKSIEIVDKVHFKGWDFLPAGRASVTSANFTLTEEATDDSKGDETEMAKMITLDEEKIEELITKKLDERKQAETKILNEKGQPTEPPKPAEKPKVETDMHEERITTIQGSLNETKEQLAYFVRKEQMAQLREMGTKAINEAFAGDEYKRFNPEQKKVLAESVDPETLYGKVDIAKEDEVKAKALELLKNEISKMDSFIAVAKLNETGYPKTGTGNGITDIQVINENTPGMEYISRLTRDMNMYMDREDDYKLPEDHPARHTLKKMLEIYDSQNYRRLLHEAAEDVTQADIALKNASISRAFIESVWPRLTALEICETGTMVTRQDIIPVETFLPAFSTDVHTDMLLLQPGESQALNVAGITLSEYPIQATPKNQSAMITSEAIATAKGLNISLIARNMALLGTYVRTILDKFMWELIIAKTQAYDATEVTSWTQLTRVGSTNEHASAHQGWVKFEYVKTLDGNGNPTTNKLIPLFGTTSTNTLQAVVAREGGGDNTALIYSDDYTINWPDGTVTLTTAGAAKAAGNLVEVKYTYTENAKFWSIVPDTGVTLYSHLLNLSQKFGEAKVMVEDRYYNTDFVAMNLSNADLIGRGPQFTQSGYTQGNVKDAMAIVQTYDGKPVKKSSHIPRGWILVGKTGGAIYYIHTPWSIEGPLAIDNTRNRYWQVEEYSANDVPVPAKFALIGVTDLASA